MMSATTRLGAFHARARRAAEHTAAEPTGVRGADPRAGAFRCTLRVVLLHSGGDRLSHGVSVAPRLSSRLHSRFESQWLLPNHTEKYTRAHHIRAFYRPRKHSA